MTNSASPQSIEAKRIVELLQLGPHPEGGFYKRIYASSCIIPQTVLAPGYHGDREASTAILYLLEKNDKSRLHKIRSDEQWHFYKGHPLSIFELSPSGQVIETILGNDILNGQVVTHIVRGGVWFGAKPKESFDGQGNESNFSLVGCTVTPGFHFEEFEMGNRDELLKLFPQSQELIVTLT
jgi:predicted cupin superfamily sugar epimerase